MDWKYTMTGEISRLEKKINLKIKTLARLELNPDQEEWAFKARVGNCLALLHMEGSDLSEDHIAAILKDHVCRGPSMLIAEARTLHNILSDLHSIDFTNKDALKIFKKDFRDSPGIHARDSRMIGESIGTDEMHTELNALFKYLQSSNESLLLQAATAFLVLEYAQPFDTRSMSVALLWQRHILNQLSSILSQIPLEKHIYNTKLEFLELLKRAGRKHIREEYYEYLLRVINTGLDDIPVTRSDLKGSDKRILLFHKERKSRFARKDYMCFFPKISSSTASRDLLAGVDAGLFERQGTKNNTVYSCR